MSEKEPFPGLEYYRRQWYAEQDRKMVRDCAIVVLSVSMLFGLAVIVAMCVSP